MDAGNSITVVPFVDTDGVVLGFDYVCGADSNGKITGIHIPMPGEVKPNNQPWVYCLGNEGWSLEEFQIAFWQLEAILTSQVFIEALERFKRESGAAQLKVAKRLIRWHSPKRRAYKCRS